MRKGLLLSSIVLAITSSLCCIVPILTILGGMSGIASPLGWVQPFRPYLIGLTIIALGIAFYQAYKPKKTDNCGCAVEKTTFLQSKGFLWSITLLSIVLMSFPYLQTVFTQMQKNNIQVVTSNTTKASFNVSGMTCESCENHVTSALLSNKGVTDAISNYETGITTVTFDKSKITLAELMTMVETKTGYKATQ